MSRHTPPRRLVSVIVPTYNASDSIAACLRAIVAQSYADIEILICDDGSTDDTPAIVTAVDDSRIRILRSEVNDGPSAARNRGIRQAAGEIVFFTDGDVEVDHDWIRNGLRHFDDRAIVGIEGKVIYVSTGYSPRYSDRIVQNLHGGEYMTANAAYRKTALEGAGLFDEALRQYEDRDLAMRARQLGRIAFAEDAVAVHMRDRYNTRSFMQEAVEVGLSLDFEKPRFEGVNRVGPIIYFSHLLTILCPPLVLAKLLMHRHPDRRDLLMLLLIYPRLVFERYIIWRWALRNRIAVI
jgi:glycosyltransferase involved in cell wall biosynthesis